MARAAAAACALLLIATAASGCGEEEGVAEGATVSAYAERTVCGGSGPLTAAVTTADGERVKLRVLCLRDARGGGVDLATAGANARRATQDSRTVAFLEAPDPAVGRFTHPILEMAGVGWVTTPASGQAAVDRLARILAGADSGDLRADVREALGQA